MTKSTALNTNIWYFTCFKTARTICDLNLTLPIAAGLVFILHYSERAATTPALTALAGYLLALITHECLHLMSFRYFHIWPSRIAIFPFGANYTISQIRTKRIKSAIAYFIPIAISILLAGIAARLSLIITPESALKMSLEYYGFALLAVGIINLLPIYPLDSYQALKCLIDANSESPRANQLSRYSFYFSIALLFLSILGDSIMASLLCATLTTLAGRENNEQKTGFYIKNLRMIDALIPAETLLTFQPTTKLSAAMQTALTSFQSVFPVMLGTQVNGLVLREELLQTGTMEDENYIAAVMNNDFISASADTPLENIFSGLNQKKLNIAIIYEQDIFKGLIMLDKLREIIMFRSIRNHIENAREDEMNF